MRCPQTIDHALINENLGKPFENCLGNSELAVERTKCNRMLVTNSMSETPLTVAEEAGITVHQGEYLLMEVHTQNIELTPNIELKFTIRTWITS